MFDAERRKVTTLKIDTPAKDLVPGPRGVAQPNPARCKPVPLHRIDIAIIPGLAFDEKGARIGSGKGYYDRFIPELPVTTRKVALAFEEQISKGVPFETPSGKIEILSTTLANIKDWTKTQYGYEIPYIPKWIEPFESLNHEKAKTFPFHMITPHPRWRRPWPPGWGSSR